MSSQEPKLSDCLQTRTTENSQQIPNFLRFDFILSQLWDLTSFAVIYLISSLIEWKDKDEAVDWISRDPCFVRNRNTLIREKFSNEKYGKISYLFVLQGEKGCNGVQVILD
ncbi:hypothetical protein TNIN_427521 [Trichonephila inaurata madagascariensis]|uniref:Uncharacterized protein n=1 Tax=Trichonephila inaurata madagascariensis TaxID=2747483 RepID=A0A8X6X4I0_9ARAC|nr:hypothetical protein TNIN_427521 [Trichonephila inaurata madagascariensis]